MTVTRFAKVAGPAQQHVQEAASKVRTSSPKGRQRKSSLLVPAVPPPTRHPARFTQSARPTMNPVRADGEGAQDLIEAIAVRAQEKQRRRHSSVQQGRPRHSVVVDDVAPPPPPPNERDAEAAEQKESLQKFQRVARGTVMKIRSVRALGVRGDGAAAAAAVPATMAAASGPQQPLRRSARKPRSMSHKMSAKDLKKLIELTGQTAGTGKRSFKDAAHEVSRIALKVHAEMHPGDAGKRSSRGLVRGQSGFIDNMRKEEQHAFNELAHREEEERRRMEGALAKRKHKARKHRHAADGKKSGSHVSRTRRKSGRHKHDYDERRESALEIAAAFVTMGRDVMGRRGTEASNALVDELRAEEERAFDALHERDEAARHEAEEALAARKHRSHLRRQASQQGDADEDGLDKAERGRQGRARSASLATVRGPPQSGRRSGRHHSAVVRMTEEEQATLAGVNRRSMRRAATRGGDVAAAAHMAAAHLAEHQDEERQDDKGPKRKHPHHRHKRRKKKDGEKTGKSHRHHGHHHHGHHRKAKKHQAPQEV